MEQQNIPAFRIFGDWDAFIEGWALYAEGLLPQIYTTLDEKIGQLDSEMFRACRLVVDTGIHAINWSRNEAVSYMLQNTMSSRHEIEEEIIRYIADPGQALAYKTGQMTFLRLRNKLVPKIPPSDMLDSEKLKDFHFLTLRFGSLPLGVYEQLLPEKL